MDKLSNIALVAQMIEAAERNLQSAKQILWQSSGATTKPSKDRFYDKPTSVMETEGGKVVEGFFDGQNMVGPDNKQYPVPANYASKSKLVEGDILKLSISEDGTFIYKQIGPVDRKKMLGVVVADERGDLKIISEGKPYKVLLASLTYYKAEVGDEVTILVPENLESMWATVENVLRKKSAFALDHELHMPEPIMEDEVKPRRIYSDIDDEL
jgi:hypothetical protein